MLRVSPPTMQSYQSFVPAVYNIQWKKLWNSNMVSQTQSARVLHRKSSYRLFHVATSSSLWLVWPCPWTTPASKDSWWLLSLEAILNHLDAATLALPFPCFFNLVIDILFRFLISKKTKDSKTQNHICADQ